MLLGIIGQSTAHLQSRSRYRGYGSNKIHVEGTVSILLAQYGDNAVPSVACDNIDFLDTITMYMSLLVCPNCSVAPELLAGIVSASDRCNMENSGTGLG